MTGVWKSTNIYLIKNKLQKELIIIKPISKKEIEKLMDKGIIRNTHKGYINKKGYHVGYYKASGNNRYIEDYYADKAKSL